MEEFNILTDFYFPIKDQEKLYNSNEYKTLEKNNIDTAELEGIEPDKDAGEIVFNKEVSDDDKKILLKDVLDFTLQLPEDTIISVLRGGHNALQFTNNFIAAVGQQGGINPDDMEWNTKFNEVINNSKKELDKMDKDSPFISKMIAMAGQDAAYTFPIYKKLKSAGVPKTWSLPIAFALGGALAFDAKEDWFLNTKSMRDLKNLIFEEPDTPIGEM